MVKNAPGKHRVGRAGVDEESNDLPRSLLPAGNAEPAFNLPHLAASLGAVFVARWTTLHVRQLHKTMLRALQKRGFRFIEVISPCPVGFGKSNDIGEGLD